MNAVELRDACKTYGTNRALNAVSLDVPQGYVTGLVGPNGAGKTTILRSVLNLTHLDTGTVSVLGLDSREAETEIRDRLGFVHEESYLFADMSPLHHERICRSAYTNWDSERFRQLLGRFDLPPSAKIRTFSKGMRMRLQLAISLSHRAELIVMDEPASGLDPVIRRDMTDVIAAEMEREDRTFFISTHVTSDLDRIADFVVVIDAGEVVLSTNRTQIAEEFALCKGGHEIISNGRRELFRGIRENEFGFTALTTDRGAVLRACGDDVIAEPATIEDLVFHLTGAEHESTLDS
jgi:ABC-2 type transport system ATP-binding protein